MRYLPVMLDLAGRHVLVVGGGAVATRKVSHLLRSGARVRLVAPLLDERLRALAASDDRVEIRARGYHSDDLDDVALVFSATGVPAVERQVFEDAGRRGLWVNGADDPDNCSFLMPAIFERGAVQVAISTGGASPALASRVRDEIGAMLGPEYAEAAERLGALRRILPAGPQRARAFDRLLDGGLLEALRRGDLERVERMTEDLRRDLADADEPVREGRG